MKSSNKRRNNAFTLIEVLLVMTILAMLAGVGIVAVNKSQNKANIKSTEILVGEVKNAVNMYFQDMSTWPTDDAGLNSLVEAPSDEDLAARWAGPYIKGAKLPQDAWSSDLNFKLVDETEADTTGIYFHVYSSGPNRLDDSGTGDDIPAWAEDK